MDLRLDGRRAVVTGGASGIGLACATALAAEGVRVVILDRNEAAGAQAAARIAAAGGGAAEFVAADVTVEADVKAAINGAARLLGGLDIAVGCAGISGPFGADITDTDTDAFDRVMAVNVRGQFLLAKHTAPHLARAKAPAIVMLASDSSFVAAPGMVAYNASKGAVLQLVRALSVDLAPRGIRVNCVCPSVVDTPMARGDLGDAAIDQADFPVQRPEDVAAHVVYLASPVSRPVNGTALVSDFGYLARSSFPA